MAAGPTQSYDDATLVTWRPRPALAVVVRVGLVLLPLTTAVLLGVLAVRLLPPARVGLHPWLWLALEVAASAAVLVLVGRLVRRLLPLPALLRLTLVLPDPVPGRLEVLRRRTGPDRLRRRLEAASADGAPADPAHADARLLLDLVAALARHDRTTFTHSERVQAYAALIAREMGLSRADTGRLGWAALLHDVGKLTVPREILDKPGRPDAAEWAVLSGHAAEGERIAAPLGAWLGPWAAAIGQHHERWDGAGYPLGLAGDRIHLGARIVAVADAFDVITSARSYKRPLPAHTARAELARCAGTQFDPAVVRAFLAVGLGELRAVAGPFALVSALPGLSTVPVPDLASVVARVSLGAPAAVPPVATAAVVGSALVVASPVVGTSDVPLLDQVRPVVEAPTAVPDVDPVTPSAGARTTDATPAPADDGTPSPTDVPTATPEPAPPPVAALPDGTVVDDGAPADDADAARPVPDGPATPSRTPAPAAPPAGSGGGPGTSPGGSGAAPGGSGAAPGRSGEAPGQSGAAPGRSGDAPGRSDEAPGRGGGAGRP